MSVAPVFRAEMSKQGRRVRTYVALGIVVFIPVLMTIALRFGRERGQPEGDGLFQLARHSGLVMPAAALFFMSQFLLVVVVAIFAGDAVAGEATWGNLRYVLVRPVMRSRLLGAKLAMSFVFMVIATVLIVVVGLIAGGIAFGFHGVNEEFFVFSIHQSAGEILRHLAIGTAYVAWNMSAVVTLAFMVSTMTDASTGAIGAGIGMSVVSQILDAIPQLGGLRSGLPTHYLGDWRALIVDRGSAADLWHGVVVQIPYVVVFVAIAFWWFNRKDITS